MLKSFLIGAGFVVGYFALSCAAILIIKAISSVFGWHLTAFVFFVVVGGFIKMAIDHDKNHKNG